jgi:hypothetical protein
VTREVNVTTASTTLTMAFVPTVNYAILSSFEVFNIGPASSFPAPPPPPSSPPPPPATTPPAPALYPIACTGPPAPPAGSGVVVVARVNVGGSAICGFSADNGSVATGECPTSDQARSV